MAIVTVRHYHSLHGCADSALVSSYWSRVYRLILPCNQFVFLLRFLIGWSAVLYAYCCPRREGRSSSQILVVSLISVLLSSVVAWVICLVNNDFFQCDCLQSSIWWLTIHPVHCIAAARSYLLKLFFCFSRSYCYRVLSTIGIIMASVCPSVCL